MKVEIIDIIEARNLIKYEIVTALDSIDSQQVLNLIEAIMKAEKVFYIAVGRVLLAMKSFAKRLTHLGITIYCVGDISEPAITQNDLLIVASGSGESIIPVAIARKANSFGAKIVHIGSNPNSSLQPITSVFLRIPVRTKLNRKDELQSQQPMTTLFDQALYLLGDIVSMVIAQQEKVDIEKLWMHHANLE